MTVLFHLELFETVIQIKIYFWRSLTRCLRYQHLISSIQPTGLIHATHIPCRFRMFWISQQADFESFVVKARLAILPLVCVFVCLFVLFSFWTEVLLLCVFVCKLMNGTTVEPLFQFPILYIKQMLRQRCKNIIFLHHSRNICFVLVILSTLITTSRERVILEHAHLPFQKRLLTSEFDMSPVAIL